MISNKAFLTISLLVFIGGTLLYAQDSARYVVSGKVDSTLVSFISDINKKKHFNVIVKEMDFIDSNNVYGVNNVTKYRFGSDEKRRWRRSNYEGTLYIAEQKEVAQGREFEINFELYRKKKKDWSIAEEAFWFMVTYSEDGTFVSVKIYARVLSLTQEYDVLYEGEP